VGWHDRAQHFLDEDNPTAAHRVANEASGYATGSPIAWMVRGYASALLEKFSDAEYELAEASRLMPGEALPRYLLGEVYTAQEKWEPALAKVNEALRFSPESAPMIAAKAAVLGAIGRDDLSITLLEPLVARHPGDDAYGLPLAAAYHDAAIGRLTRVPSEDGYIWTSEEQVAGLELAAIQIDELQCPDPEAGRMAGSLREFAERGRQIHWDTSAPNLYFWLGGFLFLWGCGIGLGPTGNLGAGIVVGLLVSVGVAGGLFALLRRRPAWKLAAQSLRKGNLSNRLMAATGRATAAVYRTLNR
jgi:tetratricopeptide (TPR) repeat protein